MTCLKFFDVYLTVFVIFHQHLDIFSQYLVTYLVPGVKGLPGGVDLGCRAGLDPPDMIILLKTGQSIFSKSA